MYLGRLMAMERLMVMGRSNAVLLLSTGWIERSWYLFSILFSYNAVDWDCYGLWV
jgi:TRAP-type mannitol/chloroaromatic compound transport system permease small subunit